MTSPVELMVATEGVLLPHVPPEIPSASVVEEPTHTKGAPEMTPGEGEVMMVIAAVAAAVPHALETEYEITALPGVIAVTIPLELTVATEVLLLLQVPPEVASTRVVVVPAQRVVVPVIKPAVGAVVTVTAMNVLAEPQELETIYEMFAEPTVTPVTFPEPSTVATPELLLLQVPPATPSARTLVKPVQMSEEPVIVPAEGVVTTVNASPTAVVPHPLVSE